MEPSTLIRGARRAAGLTQLDLARRLGRSQSEVARLEAPGSNPTVETLKRALAATGHAIEASVVRDAGIDETMIAADLAVPPDQRLRNFESFYAFAHDMGGAAGGRRSQGPASD
jgi:transcriptional regulator with XRE-family HTH domain